MLGKPTARPRPAGGDSIFTGLRWLCASIFPRDYALLDPARLILVFLLVGGVLSGCATGPDRETAEPQGSPLQQARSWKSERRCSLALEALQKAIWQEPESPEPHELRGDCLFDMARYPEAAAAYRSALAIDPLLYNARVGLWTVALVEATEPDRPQVQAQIRREVEGLLRHQPGDTGAMLASARGYGLVGDTAAANALIVRLAEEGGYQGHAAEIAQALYWAARGERNGWERIGLSDLSITRFPNATYAGESARLLFGVLTQVEHGEVTAWRLAHRYLALGPENPDLILAIAWGLVLHEQDPLKAVQLLSGLEGLKAPPLDRAAEARYLHGVALLNMVQAAEAETQFRAVLAIDPRFPRAHYQLGMLAAKQGRRRQALAHLREALRGDVPLPGAEEKLRALLARQGFRGDPRDYFARREGVPRFTDVTDRAGLKGVRSTRLAWGDYDGDGYPDLLLDGPRLFHNEGSAGFRDVTVVAGLDAIQGTTGGLWADYDADGDLDLFLYSHQGRWLLASDGAGRFTDVTAWALPPAGPEHTEAAAWGDLDNDGYLDLYIANYERPLPLRGICGQDRLLHNRGDGTFEDWSERAGILTDEPLCGRGVVWADIDADGRQDILVSNYRLDPNLLWLNRRDGTFVDAAGEKGFRGRNVNGYFGHSIGSVVGDLNGDGNLDVFVSNLAHPDLLAFSDLSQLLISSGPPAYVFTNRFAHSGIAFEETSADPSLGDVDNDGDLDLFVTSIYPGRRSHLYLNDGTGHFTDVSWLSGTRVANGWGAGLADFDRDGRLDLAVASSDGIQLLRNLGPAAHWLEIQTGSAALPRIWDREPLRDRHRGTDPGPPRRLR